MTTASRDSTSRFVAILDAAIEMLLVALLAFTPLALGAVEPWSEAVAVDLGAAIGICLAIRIVMRPTAMGSRLAGLAIALFLAFALVQFIPLPASVVHVISPQTVAMKAELLGDLPARHPGWIALTFYPLGGSHDLRTVLLATTVFLAVTAIFKTPARIVRLMACVCLIGGGLAVLALAQDLAHAPGIYWRITVPGPFWSGTFVNHSDFAQHMNLSCGFMLGMLLVMLKGRSQAGASKSKRAACAVAAIVLAGTLVLGVVSILLSLSRGGVVASLVSGAFVIATLGLRRGSRKLAIAGLVLTCTVAGLAWFLAFKPVSDRMTTLLSSKQYRERITVIEDVCGVWRLFPVLGTGLGTHEVVYPRFNTTGNPKLYRQAENEYAQVAEEMGTCGLACVLVFLGVVWRNWWESVMNNSGAAISAAAVGLGYGLLAVQVSSLSDFGLHLPAIACLSAVAVGMLMNFGRLGRGEYPSKITKSQSDVARVPQPAKSVGARLGGWVTAAGLVAAGISSIAGAESARHAAPYWERAEAIASLLRDRGWTGSNSEYADLLAQAGAAANAQPDDIHYRVWLDDYRWHAASRVADTAAPDDSSARKAVRAEADRIVSDLNDARPLCPTFGPLYTLLGQLELFVLDRPIGASHLRIAAELSPHDPVPCFAAGSLDAHQGLWDDAGRNFRHVLIFDWARAESIYDLYVHELKRPDLAAHLADDNARWLLLISDKVAKSDPDASANAKRRAAAVLEISCNRSGARIDEMALLAQTCIQLGEDAPACDWLRRALLEAPDQVDWRLERAQALVRLGRNEEAKKEALTCLRINPSLKPAHVLVESFGG